ncbi:hypothetical protein [Hymenobacter algoricola]|uniref:Uncharacterized protein n=1 Tax=Hymenobacter algoricola TaxID=486267 RepID=A0ABP7MP21_9BACT
MDPKPKQPASPAPTGPATRSTVYPDQPTVDPAPQPAESPPAESQPAPAPEAAPPAEPAGPTTPAAEPEQADGEQTLTDPTTPVQPDTSGETDPGASANNDAHPL